MTAAVLSIGSNLGDRLTYLQGMLDAMRPWLVAVSPVYETAPWGLAAQGDFLNAVVIVGDDRASAADWLARAQAAEHAAERTRVVRWGPRTLDVDVVSVDDEVSNDPALTLPHPLAHERAFVLVPWLAVDPAARLGPHTVTSLIDGLPATELAGVRVRPDLQLQ